MDYPINLPFNHQPSTILHLDINSCFATLEQQANPLLRHRPIAVAARNEPSCCIVAPSIEAKLLGIKVGTKVKEALQIYPNIIILEPDPDKYRFVHYQLKSLLQNYSDIVIPKSIDEFYLDFTHHVHPNLKTIARQIKHNLHAIGDYITVSIGLGPNWFLAKTAAGLHKPDGLDEINHHNFLDVYQNLKLTDLHGINLRNQYRLNSVGINTVLDFYHAPHPLIFSAFRSVISQDWFLRLRGYEVDRLEFGRKSFGHSYVLPRPLNKEQLLPILQKLVHKAVSRLRNAGFQTQTISLAFLYQDHHSWHQQHCLPQPLFNTARIFGHFVRLSLNAPDQPIKTIAISCQNLNPKSQYQLELFHDNQKDFKLTQAIDTINQNWGESTITPARMSTAQEAVPDSIAFGRDLKNS